MIILSHCLPRANGSERFNDVKCSQTQCLGKAFVLSISISISITDCLKT